MNTINISTQNGSPTKKPYLVKIEEINRRYVVILADDSNGDGRLDAEVVADELCDRGVINLDYDDYQGCTCETQRIATRADMDYHEIYTENGRMK